MAAVENVRLDHRRRDVPVAEPFLNGADVAAVLEHGAANGVLQDCLVKLVEAALDRFALGVDARSGKHSLPGPLVAGVGQLAC